MSQKEVLAKDEDKARKKLTDEIISDLKKKEVEAAKKSTGKKESTEKKE